MRLQRYQRAETIGFYNFGCCQVFVCTIDDPKGNIYKGITVYWAGASLAYEIPIFLEKDSALKFAEYLENVTSGNLPSSYVVSGGRWKNFFCQLSMKFTSIKGSQIKCRMSLARPLGAAWLWSSVNPSSLNACAKALRKLYECA